MMFGPLDGFAPHYEAPKELKAGRQHPRANKRKGYRQTSGRPGCPKCGSTLGKSNVCRSRKCNP